MDSYTVFGYTFTFFDIIVFVCTLGFGLYCAYTSIRLKIDGTFFQNRVLLPNGCTEKDCADPDGYFSFIRFRLLLFGIGLALSALIEAVGIILIQRFALPAALILVFMSPTLILLAWYACIQRKAKQRFWV